MSLPEHTRLEGRCRRTGKDPWLCVRVIALTLAGGSDVWKPSNWAKPCAECLSRVELRVIQRIPVEDLPLYIGHRWHTPVAAALYRRRLQRGV